jgi:hypothetical protein
MRFLLLVVLIIGFLYIDHTKTRLLPDSVYCSIGAGQMSRGYSESGGYTDECENVSDSELNIQCRTVPDGSRIYTPASCSHGSVWDAIRRKWDEATRGTT